MVGKKPGGKNNGRQAGKIVDAGHHASVQTTERYDRRGKEAKKKAVRLLHLPYRGRDRDRGS